jgi:hypothetical protein
MQRATTRGKGISALAEFRYTGEREEQKMMLARAEK